MFITYFIYIKSLKYPIICGNNSSLNNFSELKYNLKTESTSRTNDHNDKTIANFNNLSNCDEIKKENKSILLSGNKSINCFSEKYKTSKNYKVQRKIGNNFEDDYISFCKHTLTNRESYSKTLKITDSNNSNKLKIYDLFGINKKFYLDTNMNKIVRSKRKLVINLK